MATSVQIVIDCADPARLTAFWAEALHYRPDSPPAGFASWPEFLAARGVPETMWNSAGAVSDPDGRGPRFFFQQVPEPKVVKNRVHVDLNVSRGPASPLDERHRLVDAEVERLLGLGATKLRPYEERGEYWVVMQDPEGNEFCVH
jgi:hypothetical protein